MEIKLVLALAVWIGGVGMTECEDSSQNSLVAVVQGAAAQGKPMVIQQRTVEFVGHPEMTGSSEGGDNQGGGDPLPTDGKLKEKSLQSQLPTEVQDEEADQNAPPKLQSQTDSVAAGATAAGSLPKKKQKKVFVVRSHEQMLHEISPSVWRKLFYDVVEPTYNLPEGAVPFANKLSALREHIKPNSKIMKISGVRFSPLREKYAVLYNGRECERSAVSQGIKVTVRLLRKLYSRKNEHAGRRMRQRVWTHNEFVACKCHFLLSTNLFRVDCSGPTPALPPQNPQTSQEPVYFMLTPPVQMAQRPVPAKWSPSPLVAECDSPSCGHVRTQGYVSSPPLYRQPSVSSSSYRYHQFPPAQPTRSLRTPTPTASAPIVISGIEPPTRQSEVSSVPMVTPLPSEALYSQVWASTAPAPPMVFAPAPEAVPPPDQPSSAQHHNPMAQPPLPTGMVEDGEPPPAFRVDLNAMPVKPTHGDLYVVPNVGNQEFAEIRQENPFRQLRKDGKIFYFENQAHSSF